MTTLTWNVNLGGHIEDRSQETAVADVVRTIIAELQTLGLTTAVFNGNEHHEDYLHPKEA